MKKVSIPKNADLIKSYDVESSAGKIVVRVYNLPPTKGCISNGYAYRRLEVSDSYDSDGHHHTQICSWRYVSERSNSFEYRSTVEWSKKRKDEVQSRMTSPM